MHKWNFAVEGAIRSPPLSYVTSYGSSGIVYVGAFSHLHAVRATDVLYCGSPG